MSTFYTMNYNSLSNSINNQLDDLMVGDESNRFTGESMKDTSGISADYILICGLLLERLSFHDSRVKPPIGPNATIQEVFDALRPRGPHFSLDSDLVKYRIIQFLCINLQVRAIP